MKEMEGNSSGLCNIPGIVASGQGGQLLVSSGIPSFDQILGGGLPIGSVVLIEEDLHGSYAKVLLKYFLAEGIVNKQPVYVCSKDVNPESIVKDLPALIETDHEAEENSFSQKDKMTIAFRYHNLPTREEPIQQHFGHYYDLSKTMSDKELETADITYWEKCIGFQERIGFENPNFLALLESIKTKLQKEETNGNKSVLRVAIHSIGSPLWFQGLKNGINSDLNLFFYALRGLMRSFSALAVVTVPSHLYAEGSSDKYIHSSDIVLKLQSFGGTEFENNKVLSDYHGFFHITKMAAVNSLVSKHPGAIEYVFKLKKKKFKIQKLHLPPDLQDAKDEHFDKNRPSFGCGSTSKSLLDF